MKKRVTRRDFLRIAGATGLAPVLSCAQEPVRKLVPYIVAEEEIVPGVPVWYATVCRECPAGCGMLVKTREGRAIKVEGNPSHPVNQGKLCPRGQASVQGLYNDGRIRGPMVKESDGKFRAISWEEAMGILAKKIAGIKGKGPTAFVTPLLTGALDSLIIRWSKALGIRRIVYEPFAHEQLREANRISFGRRAVPVYDLEKAKFVINFGADFLETWISPVFYARQFRETRRAVGRSMPRVVHVEPRLSLTGANADEWLPLVPGTEGIFVLGMAHVILKEGLEAPGLGAGLRGRILSLTEPYTPEAVASKTGAGRDDVLRLAREFGRAKPGLAIGGGPSIAHRGGTETAVLINMLNALAGNIGKTVLFGQEEALGGADTYGDMLALARDMDAGKVPLLLLYDVNPLYTMPGPAKFGEAMGKAGFIVSFSSIRNESTEAAHLLLPDNHFLESWGGYSPRTGVYGLMQPVMSPVFRSRALGDVLLTVARTSGGPGGKTASLFPWKTFEDCLKDDWKKTWKGSYLRGRFEEFWNASLGQGGHYTHPSPDPPSVGARGEARVQTRLRRVPPRSLQGQGPLAAEPLQGDVRGTPKFQARALSGLPGGPKFDGILPDGENSGGETLIPRPRGVGRGTEGEGTDSVYLLPSPSIRHYDGRSSDRPWLQELPDPMAGISWDTWVEIHPEKAKALGLSRGDMVSVTSPRGEIRCPVLPTTIVRPDIIAVPMGQKNGENPLSLISPEPDRASGGLPLFSARVTIAKTGKRVSLALMQGGEDQRKRGIARTISVSDLFPKGAPKAEEGRGPGPGLYPPHDHPEHRWGMAIDLSACIGCGACVVACYAENNLPVVGKGLCLMGREMSWIRIERFIQEAGQVDYVGQGLSLASHSPKFVFIPMLCQHCDMAPCEYVCPVFATYHNPEGLNAQIYNRCVGTRYCSHNCPYKVRRFNWFGYTWPEPLHLQLNPDVTVREKGVMEKCSFCVQRIREGKDRAKDDGRAVRDGEIVPACAQTCPTDAIIFGDLKDPGSRVSRLSRDPRGYHVFGDLNTAPAITYLKKVIHG